MFTAIVAIRRRVDGRRMTIEIKTKILCEINGQMSEYLSAALSEGWELLTPPIFVHRGQPPGYSDYAVGYDWPHFLFMFKRDSVSLEVGRAA